MNNETPAGFRLVLLGRWELNGPNGPVDLPSKKLAALLAYLACNAPALQSRERLATLLWGSHFEPQARQNLRQAYNGPFLADVAIPEEAWADWLRSERESLECLALDAMVRLGDLELRAGFPERALAAAGKAIAFNNLREDAHRVMIRALAAAGRRADALKHYEQLAEVLKRELNVDPDASTRALVGDLRASHASRPAPQALPASSPSTGAAFPTLPDRPSLAVLPFANVSADPEQEYFADGVVEEILSALSRIRWLFVIARQSSFSYKGRAVDVRQIGRELGVRYVVEGSVRKAGNRVRIIAQLIDAETDAHIWADRYERELHDIFALQDEITERIVSAIEPTVKAIEIKRALAKPTETLTAFDSYLRALPYYYSQTKEGLGQAEALLGRAIALDPDYAEALGTFADVMTSRIANGWHASRKQEIGEACAAASRALAAGPSNSTCLAAAAYAFAVLGRRFEEALPLAERAIEAHPNSTFVRNRAGAVYANSGESDKAIDQVEIALRMNPLDNITSTFTYTVGAVAHLFARRFEESLRWGRRATAITPQAEIPRWCAASALGHLGRLDEARADVAELLMLHPIATLARARRASLQHEWMYDLYLEGLRRAGLPE